MCWRKGWDSNPRYPCRHAGFQDRCLKPLGHPSGAATSSTWAWEDQEQPQSDGDQARPWAERGWLASVRRRRPYFSELLIAVNLVLSLAPSPFTTTMIASAIPAAIRPYSMAVAPD